MVVKEDGSKWACQSCLKGHRVSGCTHVDRELTLVPKKGRPVTQCHHCRLERKKRSAHVSCDCGHSDKPHHSKEKCIHLREADERAKQANSDDHLPAREAAYLAAVASEQGCCCHHGGRCTCAILKNESGDDVVAPHGPAVKPRLEKTTSDGAITVFTNGHHKPVHRKNNAAHGCGAPYRMPMPRSHTDHTVSNNARRSVDSLALDSSVLPAPSASTCSSSSSSNARPTNGERRHSRSEQPSPKLSQPPPTCTGGLIDTQLQGIDFTTLAPTQTNQSVQSATSESIGFSPFDPMSGIDGAAFDPWSSVPSTDSINLPDNNPFGVWPTQTDVLGMSQPALTVASSGTQSEADEAPPMDEVYNLPMPSIQEDQDSSNSNGVPNAVSPQSNRHSLPPSFFGNIDFASLGLNPDWQTPIGSIDSPRDGKTRTQQNTPSFQFEDSWQFADAPAPTTASLRQLGGTSFNGRPQSYSAGSSNSPADDLMHQLFPDIDMGDGLFSSGSDDGRLDVDSGVDKNAVVIPRTDATSRPVDCSAPGDTAAGPTSQPWNDGSISVPSHAFTTPFDYNGDFSTPEFCDEWPQ